MGNKNSLPSYYAECCAHAKNLLEYYVPDFNPQDLRIFSDRGKGHELMARVTTGMEKDTQQKTNNLG